jgi:hypothetical protein
MKSWKMVLAALIAVGALMVAGPAVAGAAGNPSAHTSAPGYWLVTGYGSSYAYDAPYLGSPETRGNDTCVASSGPVPYSCVGISAVQSGAGYWLAGGGPGSETGTGGTHSFFGSTNNFGFSIPVVVAPNGTTDVLSNLSSPIVGVAAATQGCWLVGADGGVFAQFGAPFYGSMGAMALDKPVVGIASTSDGKGYWLVASDGGVFAFGDAAYLGSMGGKPLDQPIVGIASTPDGKGYWLVATDGGVFAFGDARYSGSEGGTALAAPMVGIAANLDGTGYWTVAADGGVFAFGDAPFLGSAVGQTLDSPIIGMASRA